MECSDDFCPMPKLPSSSDFGVASAKPTGRPPVDPEWLQYIRVRLYETGGDVASHVIAEEANAKFGTDYSYRSVLKQSSIFNRNKWWKYQNTDLTGYPWEQAK